jgi:hypothetical protein
MITLSETAAKKVAEHAVPGRQRDRLRRQQHDGRRLRDQEPEREVFLRVREIPSVLSAAVRT